MSILSQTATRAATVTPSDTAPNTYAALYVGGGGNVAVRTEGGDAVTFSNVVAGSILPVRVNLVKSTSTTATNIIGLS